MIYQNNNSSMNCKARRWLANGWWKFPRIILLFRLKEIVTNKTIQTKKHITLTELTSWPSILPLTLFSMISNLREQIHPLFPLYRPSYASQPLQKDLFPIWGKSQDRVGKHDLPIYNKNHILTIPFR